MVDATVDTLLEGWTSEMRAAYLYRVLADVERTPERALLFGRLAGEAESQARVWARDAVARGVALPDGFEPDRRTRVVAHLTRRMGPRAMRTVLAAMKVRGLSVYGHGVPGHPAPTTIQDMAARHQGLGQGGNLRAAVFGANDGLVSNMSLVLGVAGAAPEGNVVLLAGIAGLLAGAFSMAAGEYVSVRSQRELFEYQIGLERAELAMYPEEEAEELALIYAARGMSEPDAVRLAQATIAEPERALDTLAREELGLNPDELGSPRDAAVTSFLSFAAGAVLPLLPFIFLRGGAAIVVAAALTAVALFGVGATISLFTGRSAWAGGARMLGIGAAAGAATYLIGRVIGVAIA